MKKKLKNLTLGQIAKICDKQYEKRNYCNTCPLNEIFKYYCPSLSKKYLESEVKIDGRRFRSI